MSELLLITRAQARAIGQILDLHHPDVDHVEIRHMTEPQLIPVVDKLAPVGLFVRVDDREWGVHTRGWVYGYNDVKEVVR